VPVQTQIEIKSKSKPAEVKVEYPKGKVIQDPVLGKYHIYEGKASIKASIRRAADTNEPLDVTVKFQACNEKQCLLPVTMTVKVPSGGPP
jgi:hypothetical protein